LQHDELGAACEGCGEIARRKRIKGDDRMSAKLNVALVIALTGTIGVRIANGDGPLVLKRIVSGVLSNPVPRS